jgi:hypothetical protein
VGGYEILIFSSLISNNKIEIILWNIQLKSVLFTLVKLQNEAIIPLLHIPHYTTFTLLNYSVAQGKVQIIAMNMQSRKTGFITMPH